MDTSTRDGWAQDGTARVPHYYRGNRALCSGRLNPLPKDPRPVRLHDCRACQRLLSVQPVDRHDLVRSLHAMAGA